MADDPDEPKTALQSGWGAQCRASEELDYFTELALHETRRWIELVTKKGFKYENDFRASLEDGILLCELLNGLRPGTIRKINRLPTPIAGLDNINVFLEACQTHFGLKDSQLFHPCDLEDLSTRAVSDSEDQLKAETQRRLRNVAITVFWLGKVSRKYNFHGPLLDLTAFVDLVSGGRGSAFLSPPPTPSIPSASPSVENISHQWSASGSTPTTPSLCSATPSIENVSIAPGNVELTHDESTDSVNCSSAYGSFGSEAKNLQSSDAFADVGELDQRNSAFASPQIGDDGSEPCVSDRSVTSDYREDRSVESEDLTMPVRHGTSRQGTRPTGSEHPAKRDSDNDQCCLNSTSNNNDNNDNKLEANDDYNNFRFSGQRTPSQNSLDKMVRENDLLNSRLGMRKSTGGRPDALQFIKTSGVTTMAEKAKETVTLMKQQKEKKKVVEVTEEDWQSNLSDWKSKMRRKSSGSLQRAQESLEYETISREEETATKRKSKTFKEMMEEREKRKSGSYHFYPVDDSEDLSFSNQKTNRPDTSSDEKLSLFGFQKVDEPQRITRTEHRVSSSGRMIFDSRTYDGGKQSGSLKRDDVAFGNSERRSTSVNDEEQTKEEIAAWALEDDEEVGDSKSATTTKTSTTNKDLCINSMASKSQNQNTTYSSKEQGNQSEVKSLPIHFEQSASSMRENNKQFTSARSMFENAAEPEIRNIPVKVAAPPKKIGVIHEHSKYSSGPVETKSTKQMYSFNKRESAQEDSGATKETDRQEEIQRLPITKVEKPQKNCIEKVIKISQKPDNKKGFGFTIRGGKEFSSPIMVEKVVLGGAADVCELMPGDEIVSINGALVANHYQASVQLVISQAVKAGQIELCIRRSFDKGKMDLFDEEDFEMEQEFERERHQERNKAEPSVDHLEKQVLPPWQMEHKQKDENRAGSVGNFGPSKEQFDFNTEKDVPLAREEFSVNRMHPNMTDSAADIRDVREDEVPEVPCPPGFGDPSLEQQTWSEIEVHHSESEQAVNKDEQNIDEDAADEPPPLPAAPPPAPNWDTFPGEPTPTAAPDLSFLDPSDLVPEVNETNAPEDNNDDLEQVGIIKTRMEQLRRKAEFLGQNYQDTEEYKKLEELKRELEANHEKKEWEKIEQQNLLSTSSLLSGKEERPSEVTITESTHVLVETRVRSSELAPVASKPTTNQSDNGNRRSDDDDAVAKLELEELQRQSRLEELDAKRREATSLPSEPWSDDQMRSWKSMEMLRSGNKLKEYDSAGSQAYYQEKFEQDQEKMRLEREERMRRAGEIENEKKKMEEKLLEKELARQRELEEIKRKRDEERRVRQQQEEKERKEQERREEIERRQRHHRLEAERRKREECEELERRQKQLKQEAERRAEQARLEMERRKGEKQNNSMKMRELQLEAEKLARQEVELKAKEAELRSLEAERMRQIEEEQRRREEELRRYEEEQRRKDEEERREEEAIRQKELELKRLEEKLRQEEEKLRQQREQLHQQQNQMMYKTDQVSVMHTSRDNIHKGDFEYIYQPEPPPPQPLEPELRSQESRYPEQRYAADRGIPESRSLEPSKTVITERTERFEVKPSSQVTPPITQRVIIKREPLIPPKPSIKSELASWSRKDVLDVSRRPVGQFGFDDAYQSSPLQARRHQELQNNRKSWSPEVSHNDQSAKQQNGIYPQNRGGSMTREEVLSMNRRSFTRKEFPSPEREHSSRSKSPSPPHSVMTKKTLHSLGAAPKSRLMSSEQWIRNEPKDRPRRSEVIRSSVGSVSEHWLVEEAERWRLAEMRGEERLSYPNSWSKI